MLTPEKLDYITNRLTVQKELEESVLRDIVKRIVKTDIVGETSAWQTERLQQSGMLYADIVKRVAAETKKSEEEIKKAFDDAETEIYDAGDVPTRAMERVWQAAFRKTCTTARNLTKTTAVTSQNKYLMACDVAHMQVSSGAFTFDAALRNAVKAAAAGGMTVFYPTGATAALDVAIRRSLLTGLNQTAGEINKMRCEELGCDLVEVSAHYGARPSHAEWQGKVYSLSGETQGYEKLADATGYGTGAGLMGWNCNHNFAPFQEGSKRNYTDEQLQDMKEHTVTYNGESMPDYEASQLQRGMERDIRKTKRELTALDELQKNRPTDETKAEFAALSVKLKNQEAKLKNFCRQTERRIDTTRTGVFATQSGMGFGRSTSAKAVWANRKSLTGSGNGSIIKEKSKSSITKISDGVIAKVPKVSIAGFTDAQNAFIQEQHKELLKYARDNNDSKEVAFVFNSRFEKIGTYKGSNDEIELGSTLYGGDLIVLHNHPRNSSYSTTDMQFILSNRSVKTITIVKNNGAVETLTKTENFDEQKAITELKRAYKSFVKTQNDTEISKAISKFIEQYEEGLSWKKQ